MSSIPNITPPLVANSYQQQDSLSALFCVRLLYRNNLPKSSESNRSCLVYHEITATWCTTKIKSMVSVLFRVATVLPALLINYIIRTFSNTNSDGLVGAGIFSVCLWSPSLTTTYVIARNQDEGL
jgi:hypothetical protein